MIFLRPWGFLMLLVPLLWILFKRHIAEQSPWKKFMDEDLWEALKVKSARNKAGKKQHGVFLLLWLLWTVALAGPAWYKLPMPARVSQPNTILMMDLNPEMPADTLKKMQMRLYDVLDLLKGHRVALVLYGGNEGYTAMPLTPDRALVQQLVPDLTPNVVPQAATNPIMGIRQCEKLIRQTGQTGQILFLTPDTEQKLSADYPLYLLGPQTNLAVLWEKMKTSDALAENADYQAQAWADMGIWLVLLSLPLMLLCFRKNVLFLFLIFIVSSAEAGFFTRPDQDAYQAEKRAVDAYRKGDYVQAQNLFQSPYNKGNALAYQGQIEQAISAYEQALKDNPNDEDAKFNKEYLEKQLPPPDQQQQKQNQQKQSENKDNQDQSDNSENQNEQSQENQNNSDNSESQESQDEQNASKENQSVQEDEKSGQQQDMQPTQDQTIEELQQALADQPSSEPFNQKEQQILNRLNLDPSRVLRYRLNLQHQRNQQ